MEACGHARPGSAWTDRELVSDLDAHHQVPAKTPLLTDVQSLGPGSQTHEQALEGYETCLAKLWSLSGLCFFSCRSLAHSLHLKRPEE